MNPHRPLKTRNLLILLGTENAKNAQYAPFGHVQGTRKNDPLGCSGAGQSCTTFVGPHTKNLIAQSRGPAKAVLDKQPAVS